ncbi:probable 18S rRNA (guanine-N(7))-methyltransferase [Gigantopelta aegis]|uniref:probable 18S rRNA (guanine-N(7))-methyltransferase n=1 Tax=Gigantopelta aegis TaxID=1735272 RepID=UPI001B88DA32|nr:probable 18S rRNA (guanine-N(7))-methyltransferase [Gigantopelta aegis]
MSKQGSKFIKLNKLSDLGLRNLRGGKARRPELTSMQSGVSKANVYIKASRAYTIQLELAQKAMDLLHLVCDVNPAIVLDLGCGSGISSKVIADRGHFPIGVDINPSVLKLMTGQRDCSANAVLSDISKDFPFRRGIFDTAVSISFLQWLIVDENVDTLSVFFRSLKLCLTEKGAAVLQFYPRTVADVEKTVNSASLFFKGFLVCDYPHKNRGKKLFIVLFSL